MSPIFIHSLHRCGSTWLFNVFRRSEDRFWCYAEPEHHAVKRLLDADALLTVGEALADQLRHHGITAAKPYFWELEQIKDRLADLADERIAYEHYFAGDDLDPLDRRYFGELIAAAPRRPVLQLCRSVGRAAALKRAFGGTHLHLWREPISQWWSMKVDPYFDDAVHLVFHHRQLPAELAWFSADISPVPLDLGRPLEAVEQARASGLSPERRYRLFYALWFYAQVRLRAIADVDFSIDRATADEEYRASLFGRLAGLGASEEGLADCKAPAVRVHRSEEPWYQAIEQDVHSRWRAAGYGHEVERVAERLGRVRALIAAGHDAGEECRRQRKLMLDLETRFYDVYRKAHVGGR